MKVDSKPNYVEYECTVHDLKNDIYFIIFTDSFDDLLKVIMRFPLNCYEFDIR